MQCPEHETLNEYIDGELSPAYSKTLAEHIELCQECRNYTEEIKAISFQTAQMPIISLSQKAKMKIRSKIKEASSKPTLLETFISLLKNFFQSPYAYAALMITLFMNILISTETLSPTTKVIKIGSYYERVLGNTSFHQYISMDYNLKEDFNE